jgi:hypothetical protein
MDCIRFWKKIFNLKWVIFCVLIQFQIIIIYSVQVICKLHFISRLICIFFEIAFKLLRLTLNLMNCHRFLIILITLIFQIRFLILIYIQGFFDFYLERRFSEFIKYFILNYNMVYIIFIKIFWQIYLSITFFPLPSLWCQELVLHSI